MDWRGPGVVLALLLTGSGVGFAASAQMRDTTVGIGIASPVPVERPSLPVQAPRPYRPDPDDPPLRRGIPMTEGSLGAGDFEIFFPVPAGWRTNANATNETKWKKPGTSNNSYVMRIEQIDSQDITIEDAINIRVERLRREQEDVVILDRGAASLEYTYRSNEDTKRHSFMRWLDLDNSGQADVEIVVHGRERDVPGTRDLIQRVAEGMRGASGGPVQP
jgi:hypothetical protein